MTPTHTADTLNSIITAVPALGQERSVEWPKRTSRTLPNGLQVVLAESHNFPKLIAQLFFRTGNASVAATQPGLAEMTAAVARTGTHSRTSESIEEDLRRIGADLGTSAGADTSAISVAGLAEFPREVFSLIIDLARNASFPPNEFERIRRHRQETLRIERTTPGFLAGERLRRILFGAHPYAVIAPTEQQIQSYRIDDLKAFYARAYTPSNALLVVVGDFETEKLFALIEELFGSWTAPAPAVASNPAPPVHRGRQVHFVHLPGTVQTEVLVGNMGITRLDPDWYRFALANSIYGGAFNSRLVMNIREQKGYTYSPRSTVHALREYGYFTIHAAVRNDVVAATLTEMFYEADRMRSVPVGAQELADAQSYMSGVFSLGVATQEGLVTQLSTVYLNNLPQNYLDTYRESIRALSSQDVTIAARRHFDSANAQIVIVGDRAQARDQAALFGEVTDYEASEPTPDSSHGTLI
jgi:zinc protease